MDAAVVVLAQAAVPKLGQLVRHGRQHAVGGADLPVRGLGRDDVGDVEEVVCEKGIAVSDTLALRG
jgi:hypothetical protein